MTTKKATTIEEVNAVTVSKIQVPEPIKDLFSELELDEQSAGNLLAAFGLPLNEVGPLLDNYEDIKVESADDVEAQAEAKKRRLTLKHIRTGVEKTRKSLKERSLKEGKAIDGVARYIREQIEPAEQYLQLQEDFIKIKEEKELAERIAKRTEQLVALGADPSVYSLGDMSADAFNSLLDDIKDANAARAAREKAEKEAEEKAAAEKAAEDERIRQENERLKAEAAEAEAKAEAERKVLQEKLAQAQREKEEAEKLEAERLAFEAQQERDRQEEARRLAAAPDKEKLSRFNDALEVIRTAKIPEVESVEAQEIALLIDSMLVRMRTVIAEKLEKL